MAQYEALTLLKDLSVQADLARPPSMTLGQSLTDLYESSECCDLILCYRGYRLPVHRAILMARCPYFSRHLTFSQGSELHLRTPNYNVSLATLKRAIKYLYSGCSDVLTSAPSLQSDSPDGGELTTIALLQDEFGTPNTLESDIAYLWESGSLADCRLNFNHASSTLVEQPGDKPALELVCHRTILAARSVFFRKLIERRIKSNPYLINGVMDISLDGDILPAKYGKVLLHAMYHDNLDLRLVNNSVSPQYLGQNSAASAPSEVSEDDDDHAMNLYEIGRFLEFSFLSLSCEDLLMQHLSSANVIKIFKWSLKPHGSAWIARQAFLYLEEEFYSVSNSDVLSSLDQETLAKILQSDFIQASEAEILQALLRWGESQLNAKNSCTKEPFSGSTVSTLTRRRDTKRKDVCESELKELLAPLFPFVRFPHVLPRDKSAEVLDMVLARNLYPVLPNFTSQLSCSTKYSPWDPRCSNGLFVRPRLFIPYFEECKNLIHDRCAPDPELISSSSPSSQARDTVYMSRGRKKEDTEEDDEEQLLEFQSTKPPDKELISKMLDRVKKLLNSYAVQRSLAVSFIEQQEIIHLVELRVVREFNLPDNYVNILRKIRSRDSLKGCVASSSLDLRQNFMTASSSDASYSQDFFRPHGLEVDPHFSLCGPDVTLATSAISSLSLHHHHPSEPDSPDLVSVDGSSTVQGSRFLKNPRHKRHHHYGSETHFNTAADQQQTGRRHSQTSDQVLMSRSFNCPPRGGGINLSNSRMFM